MHLHDDHDVPVWADIVVSSPSGTVGETASNRQIMRISAASIKRDIDKALTPAIERAKGILLSEAGRDGKIPVRRDDEVVERVGSVVQRVFVGPNMRSAYASDGVTPLAEYPAVLNKWYVYVVGNTAKVYQRWMQRSLPSDVYQFLQTQTALEMQPLVRRPGETPAEYRQRLIQNGLFRPNPISEYDPMHRWVDPRGYRLSDRIWRTSNVVRQQIDAMLTEGIRQGRGAEAMARDLERFLRPSRADFRTNRPYGRDASYDAMRLARTEIARAANQSAWVAAFSNPYVDRMDVVRSNRGDPKCPICPVHATIDIGGGRIREPYRVEDTPIPTYHPHCMCHLRPLTTEIPRDVTAQIRIIMQDPDAAARMGIVSPAMGGGFILLLLGAYLYRQWQEMDNAA